MLAWLPRVENQGRRRVRLPTVGEQRADARLPPARREPKHDRLRALDQAEADRRRAPFDGERDAAHDRRGELEDEPGHGFEIDTGALETLSHLAAVRECVWVAGEKNRDLATQSRESDDLFGGIERADLGSRRGEVKQPGATTIAVANYVGLPDRLDRLHRGQTWVSGTDTHEPNPDARTHEKRLELSRNHVVGERGQRLHCLATTHSHELVARIGCQRACALDGTLGSMARPNERHDLLRLDRGQRVSRAEQWRQATGDRSLLHREHERKRGETFGDVVADRLADLVLGARVIEHVVRDLECEPEETAVISQMRARN